MTAITFGTLKFVQTLEKAGIPHVQAEAFAEALRQAHGEALDAMLAAKADTPRIEQRLAAIEGEPKLNRWMMGLLLAGVISLILKAFF